jgi:transposase
MLPGVVRTYAPIGETPVLRAPLSYEHLSVISAITPAGQLLLQMQDQAYHSEDVVRFLKHVLRHIDGKLLIIWEGASIHRSKVIRQFLREGGAERIHLERLPAYAPDLNPDEGIWQYLKHVELRNVCCHNLDELRLELRLVAARLRHRPHVIKGCITATGLNI